MSNMVLRDASASKKCYEKKVRASVLTTNIGCRRSLGNVKERDIWSTWKSDRVTKDPDWRAVSLNHCQWNPFIHPPPPKKKKKKVRGGLKSYTLSKRTGLKGLRAESARAVTGRWCPHSGRGEDFLSPQQDFFTETAVTPERKVEKWFPRWEINRHVEG